MVLAHFDSLIDPLLQQISLQLRLHRYGRKSLGTISDRQRHVLRRVLRVVIASEKLTDLYSSELLARHRVVGFCSSPFWYSDDALTDFETIVREGVENLSDYDLIALAVVPCAVKIAHEYLNETIQDELPIADSWQAVLNLIGSLHYDAKLQGLQNVFSGADVSQQDPSLTDLFYDCSLLASLEGVSPVAIAHRAEEDLGMRCVKCDAELLCGDDTCPVCGYCLLNEYYASEVSDDFVMQGLLAEDWGASLTSA